MKCEEIRDLISPYIDNMLEESERSAFEAHLSACDVCRKEYNEIREAAALLGDIEMLAVPDVFALRMKKALEEEKKNLVAEGDVTVAGGDAPVKIIEKTGKKNRWRIYTSIAAVVAIGVISISLYSDILPDSLRGAGESDMAVYDSGTGSAAPESANIESEGIESGNAEPENTRYKSIDSYGIAEEAAEPQLMMAGKEAAEGAEDAAAAGAAAKEADGSRSSSTAENSEAPMYSAMMDAASDDSVSDESAPADGLGGSEEINEVQNREAIVKGDNLETEKFYTELLEEKLKDYDYQLRDTEVTEEGLQFLVFIFRDKDGNTYNKEVTLIGKDGKIQVVSPDEFKEL